MADWSDRRYGDTLDTQQFGRQPNQRLTRQCERISAPSPCPNLDTFTLRHKMTKKMSSDQTNSSLLFNSLRLNSLRRTNNNKHNDTVNLHAQNCCTQNSKNQTHPKISQNVYKSKRNLVAKCVRITHRIHYGYC